MIVSFGDRETELLFHGRAMGGSRRYSSSVRKAALRKLDMLNVATQLNDLRSPPGNRLQALRGNWSGWHSIRVNDQFRIVFRWLEPNAHDVRLIDYH